MKQSAGILVFRRKENIVEVLLAHPGGPFWAKKDQWSIPKGELEDNEDHEAAARREFKEELGFEAPQGELIDLGTLKATNKINQIWAVEGDPDLKQFAPESTVTMEWPPRSGQKQEFPESDRIAWFSLFKAKQKLFKNQAEFIDRLAEKLGVSIDEEPSSEDSSQQALF